MSPNRITPGRRMRRALALAALVVGLAAGLAACGGDDDGSTVDPEADAVVLSEVLGRQLAAVAAYGDALPALRGADLAMARRFRVQEQEHVDATTKTLRGLEQPADPVEETVDAGELETGEDALDFLYRLESATIDAELNAVSRLTVGWTRPLIAAMAANQAQRLVLIHRALGAPPLATVPEAFESGETSAPEGMMGK
jgi:Ferritin-like domain